MRNLLVSSKMALRCCGRLFLLVSSARLFSNISSMYQCGAGPWVVQTAMSCRREKTYDGQLCSPPRRSPALSSNCDNAAAMFYDSPLPIEDRDGFIWSFLVFPVRRRRLRWSSRWRQARNVRKDCHPAWSDSVRVDSFKPDMTVPERASRIRR